MYSYVLGFILHMFVTRVTRRVSHVEQELLTILEHTLLNGDWWFSIFSFLEECFFLDRCLSFCPVFLWPLNCLLFDLRVLITPFGIFKLFSWHYTMILTNKWYIYFIKQFISGLITIFVGHELTISTRFSFSVNTWRIFLIFKRYNHYHICICIILYLVRSSSWFRLWNIPNFPIKIRDIWDRLW